MSGKKVVCPQCKIANVVPPLPSEGGYVQCAVCGHRFKVVPKPRTQTQTGITPLPTANQNTVRVAVSVQQSGGKQQNIGALLKQAATASDVRSEEMIKQEKAVARSDKRVLDKFAKIKSLREMSVGKQPFTLPKIKITSSKKNNSEKSDKQQNKPQTKAEKKQAAEVKTQKTETKTAADISTLNLDVLPRDNMPIPAPQMQDMQMPNLVFTLLPPETQHLHADLPLLLNDTIEKTDEISANQHVLREQQDRLHREFNWTLASLVALTILIIQLFYFITTR
ncbi:hypothetical protein [Stenoxybacter acetivorans]|uniref:hypothetical protein n=1 Tax=Stenoxybacter acetivorans TaxID=422441 RepID=UPI00055BB33D|nr:hypothetical protein [Stenoxybacter acetivorans]